MQAMAHTCIEVEKDSPAPDQPCFGMNHLDSHADVSKAGARIQKKVWASEVITPRRTCRPNDDELGLGINPTI